MIILCLRVLKHFKDCQLYGTSAVNLNVERRGVASVRDFMLPEMKKHSSRVLNVKTNGDLFMFLPDSLFKRVWGIFTIIALIYTATIMPYRIAFIEDDNYPFFITDTVIDVFFMTDVLVTFNSPIDDE